MAPNIAIAKEGPNKLSMSSNDNFPVGVNFGNDLGNPPNFDPIVSIPVSIL